jgi:hypothetical protein
MPMILCEQNGEAPIILMHPDRSIPPDKQICIFPLSLLGHYSINQASKQAKKVTNK